MSNNNLLFQNLLTLKKRQPLQETKNMNRGIKVVKFILQDTGTYNQMYSRPYTTYVDTALISAVSNRFDESNGRNISPDILAGVASNIIIPSANVQGNIDIANGWSERRIRFVLEVEFVANTGNTCVYYFQGYTTHQGVSLQGSIDPNMEFIINSYIRVARTNVMTSTGLVSRETVNESAQLINGIFHVTNDAGRTFRMRPQDVFVGIQHGFLKDAYSMEGGSGLYDSRITLTGDTLQTNRQNNVPVKYLTKLLQTYRDSIDLTPYGVSETDIYETSINRSYEYNPSENPFLRMLFNVKGNSTDASFTWRDLLRIDPDVERVTQHLKLNPMKLAELHSTGQSAYWNASDRETVFATSIINIIPSLMLDCLMTGVVFKSTNYDIGGVVNTIVVDFQSFTNIDMSPYLDMFKDRFARECLFDITYQNQDSYYIEVRCDLYGETILDVSIGGGPRVRYAVPSFSDAKLTPILTPNVENFYNLVHDFEYVFNGINNVHSNATPYTYKGVYL